MNLGRSALTSRLGNRMEKAYVWSSVSYPLGTQTTKWDESQSSSKYNRAHIQANTRVRPARSGDWAPHRQPRPKGLAPLLTASGRRPVPHRGWGGRREPAGWGQAVPGDFTLFEARVFRDRRCHSGSFSLLLHWHLPPSPARWTGRPGRGIALRRRPRSAGSRLPGTAAKSRGATPPRVSSFGAVRSSAGLSPAVSRLGLFQGDSERRQRGTHSSREEQAAQPDPEADGSGPEVTQQGSLPGQSGVATDGTLGFAFLQVELESPELFLGGFPAGRLL